MTVSAACSAPWTGLHTLAGCFQPPPDGSQPPFELHYSKEEAAYVLPAPACWHKWFGFAGMCVPVCICFWDKEIHSVFPWTFPHVSPPHPRPSQEWNWWNKKDLGGYWVTGESQTGGWGEGASGGGIGRPENSSQHSVACTSANERGKGSASNYTEIMAISWNHGNSSYPPPRCCALILLGPVKMNFT